MTGLYYPEPDAPRGLGEPDGPEGPPLEAPPPPTLYDRMRALHAELERRRDGRLRDAVSARTKSDAAADAKNVGASGAHHDDAALVRESFPEIFGRSAEKGRAT